MNDYKNTGIEWLPLLPSTWEVRKVKQCFYISKSKAKQENPTILKLARESIQVRDVTNNEGQIAESYFDYNPVNTGDLLINPMDLYSGANCNVSELEGVISPAYINLRKKVLLSPKYFDYYFKYQYWTMAMFAHGKGVSFDNRWTINSESMLNYELPFPSYYIQDLIVRKLNEELVKVDQLIQNQKQQIEKLKEYKQSLISEVVTKGLDPNVVFKDSGIKWIGKIPKHWDILQLKRIGKVVNGSTPKSDNSMFWDGEIYWATPTDFKDGQIIDNTARKITNLGYSSCNTTLVKKGSILITCRAPIGNVAINDKDMCFNQGCKAIVTNIDNRYFYYFLVCMNEPLNIHGQGTTFLEISTNSLSNFMIVYPAESERNLIANYLDMKINEIDAIISIKTKKIEKLKEYKKSLIYEYVTGKKEVS